MNIQTTKLELVQMILDTQKESVLTRIKMIFEEEGDWWDELSAGQLDAIQEGLDQLDRGQSSSNEEVMARINKRFFSK